jgi:hypothetical protein
LEIHVFTGNKEVEMLKFQLPYGVLRVENKHKPIFYPLDKNEPKSKTRWGEEAETAKAAAVILAAINGKEEWDDLEEELIKFLFKSHEKGEIKTDAHN